LFYILSEIGDSESDFAMKLQQRQHDWTKMADKNLVSQDKDKRFSETGSS
jgi:hypothetical protein